MDIFTYQIMGKRGGSPLLTSLANGGESTLPKIFKKVEGEIEYLQLLDPKLTVGQIVIQNRTC